MDTIIDIYYKENNEILKYFEEQNEVSFRNDADNKLKKILLLYIASYFEKEISELITDYVNHTSGSAMILSFVQNKAIKRQYHTYFTWDGNNANSFFSMFGQDFKQIATKEIKEKDLESPIKSFLELGSLRNSMVHQNAGSFVIEKTTAEIYETYKEALKFLLYLREKFKIE